VADEATTVARTVDRLHAAPIVAIAPVMPSRLIMMLFIGWDIVMEIIVTGMSDVVESKTRLQLRR